MARGEQPAPRRCNLNLKERWKVGKWHGPVLPGQRQGIAYRDGALYVADIDKIYKYNKPDGVLDNMPKPEVVATMPAITGVMLAARV